MSFIWKIPQQYSKYICKILWDVECRVILFRRWIGKSSFSFFPSACNLFPFLLISFFLFRVSVMFFRSVCVFARCSSLFLVFMHANIHFEGCIGRFCLYFLFSSYMHSLLYSSSLLFGGFEWISCFLKNHGFPLSISFSLSLYLMLMSALRFTF